MIHPMPTKSDSHLSKKADNCN